MDKVQVTNIYVKKYKIICIVKVDINCLYSNESIKKRLLKVLPSLAHHKCKNAHDNKFVNIMDNTSIPHILEHIIIDYQIEYLSNNRTNVRLLGTTEFLSKDEGIAKIELDFFDDIVALKSISKSQNLLNSIIDNELYDES